MAVTSRRVVERVLDRIAASEYRLTVIYPVAPTVPTGTTAIPLPVSPLLPSITPTPETGEEPERVQPSITMRCLFTEVAMLGQLRQERMSGDLGGWSRETTALARVSADDAELPQGGTVFDGAAHVEVNGARYKVLNVVKQSASTSVLGTYYVHLGGANNA